MSDNKDGISLFPKERPGSIPLLLFGKYYRVLFNVLYVDGRQRLSRIGRGLGKHLLLAEAMIGQFEPQFRLRDN
jgi:hypothetical protein